MHDVAQPVPPLGQRHDRVAHELARAVVGHVAAPVGRLEVGAHVGRRHQQVRRIGLAPQRVDVGMLEEQQIVAGRARMESALEGEGLPVGDPAQPAGPQRGSHASSASQSRVSMIVRIVCRNLEA